MDIKELEYVVAIAEEGSIKKAAERLYMAQSSMSQFLSNYEAELGAKIFVRTSTGVRPTYTGEKFVAEARSILEQYRRAKFAIQEREELKKGHIEFGISTFRGTALLPYVLKRFYIEYPSIEVVIHEYDSLELLKKMSDGTLDLAMIAMTMDQEHPQEAKILQDEVYLIADREHPVMEYVHIGDGGPNRPWVDMAKLGQFNFLLSNPNRVLGRIAQDIFKKYNIRPNVVNTNLTAYFAAEMAYEGLGLAFTYRSCARPRKNVVYLSIDRERCFVNLVLIYPPDGYRSSATRVFEKIIRQYIHFTEIN